MKKVLVANRGEIALRVMRSLREMGISSVAVYSEADRLAPFVQYADEAILLGPPPSAQSYLLGEKIIEEALKLGVEGIHPGYGFLSENADFATKVEAAGITFIGPSPHSITIMGSKLAAKAAVASYDIPMVPGIDRAVEDPKEAIEVANKIGYPILIKASAGGGGKGMRVVERAEDLEEQMKLAVSEAESSFGDGSVFVEKYIGAPRHIEIQILADQHGNTVHLFERECSIQRRHQKVIEEAPSAVLDDKLRAEMGQAAIRVAESCKYHGAGTVEFLLDENKNFFFLEMNTRLQVEHPVTEMITGVDLVREQINVARGEKLAFRQEDLKIKGHAMEVRVYAEDPCNNFLPDIGKLERYVRPQGPGVRVDDGFEEGMDIPIYYDPMIAKLVTFADDRILAIDRMKRAIQEYKITGIETTLAFAAWVMDHPLFRSADIDTNFIKKHFKPEMLQNEKEDEIRLAAFLSQHLLEKKTAMVDSASSANKRRSNWKSRKA